MKSEITVKSLSTLQAEINKASMKASPSHRLITKVYDDGSISATVYREDGKPVTEEDVKKQLENYASKLGVKVKEIIEFAHGRGKGSENEYYSRNQVFFSKA